MEGNQNHQTQPHRCSVRGPFWVLFPAPNITLVLTCDPRHLNEVFPGKPTGSGLESALSGMICNSIFPPSSASPLCSAMDCGMGSQQGSLQEGHSRGLAKPLLFLPSQAQDILIFFPQCPNPSSVGEGHMERFICFLISVNCLTQEGSSKGWAGNPSCALRKRDGKRAGNTKAEAQSRFRASTLIFPALLGLNWS